MAATSSDILVRLTTKSGSAGNTNTSTPAASLGKFLSTTLLVSASLHNLFDLVTGAENQISDIEYRCLGILNNHGSDSIFNVRAFIVSQDSGGITYEIGADPASSSPKGQGSDQFEEIATDKNAPTGVSFSTPSSYASGVTLGGGTIAAGSCAGLWIRRVAANTSSKAADSGLFRLQWDSV